MDCNTGFTGSIYGYKGYTPIIIRPAYTSYVPDDCSRDVLGCGCKAPRQTVCSQSVATDYYGMNPIISPDEYNNRLKELFKNIVGNNAGLRPLNPLWNPIGLSIFCNDTQTDIKSYIEKLINEGISKSPDQMKNGSWKVEYYSVINPNVYQFISSDGNFFYHIEFTLHNSTRSISTLTEITLLYSPGSLNQFNNSFIPIYMNFVNQLEWKSERPVDGISSYNIKGGIDVNTTDNPLMGNLYWNFMNTLNIQEFDKNGFYNPNGYNYNISGSVPNSLMPKINMFTKNEYSYLTPFINENATKLNSMK